MGLFSTPAQKAEKLYQAALKKGGGDNFLKAAEMGHPRAQMMYGISLFHRPGERVKALGYLEKAALQGCVGGLITELDRCTPEELEPFLARWACAAGQGDPWAGYLCAETRCRGYAVPFGDSQLFAWCGEAAQSGQREAMFLCGWMLEHGLGTETDPLKALALYEEAAGQGLSVAMFRAGELYRTGAPGLPADKAKAQALFEQAAERSKDPSVLGACARMYLPGAGPGENLEKALELYQAAFRRLHDVSFPRGDDVERDLRELGREFFGLEQADLARPLLEYGADQGYIAPFLLLAALHQWERLEGRRPEPPKGAGCFLAPRPRQEDGWGQWGTRSASFCFSTWRDALKPGDSLIFGRFPQNREPGAYKRGARPEPLVWDVLDIRDGRVLLVSANGLAYSRGKVCDIPFLPAEQALVQEGPFHLSDAEYQEYVMEKHFSGFDAPATMHAAMEIIVEKGWNYELHKNPDGTIHEISYKEWEWEPKWEHAFKGKHTPEWALRDRPAGEHSVSRPAIWLGLK